MRTRTLAEVIKKKVTDVSKNHSFCHWSPACDCGRVTAHPPQSLKLHILWVKFGHPWNFGQFGEVPCQRCMRWTGTKTVMASQTLPSLYSMSSAAHRVSKHVFFPKVLPGKLVLIVRVMMNISSTSNTRLTLVRHLMASNLWMSGQKVETGQARALGRTA